MEGIETYGRLPLPFDVFAPRVLEIGRRRGEEAGYGLAGRVGADLFLAIACDEGIDGAWRVLETRFCGPLVRLALRSGATRSEADELVRDLPGDLFAPPPSGRARTRIGTYEGSGHLLTWLSLVLLRRMADRWRERRRERECGRPGARAEDSGKAPDPARLAIEAETERRLRKVLDVAWRRMSPREVLALCYAFRDRLRQKEIAMLMGVSQPTACRILQGALEKLGSLLRAEIPEAGLGGARGLPWASLRAVLGRRLAFPDEKTDKQDQIGAS